MTKTCPHCGSSSVVVDQEKSTEVCSECGVVLGEGSFENDGKTSTYTGYDASLVNQDWRTKAWNFAVNPKAKYYQLHRRVKEQIERLRLAKDFIPQVVEIMKSVYTPNPHIVNLPRSQMPVIAGCIFIVCRQNGVILTERNVAEAARCKLAYVHRVVRLVTSFLNIELQRPSQDDVLDTILTQFDVKDPTIKELAYDVKNFLNDTMISGGRNRVVVYIGTVKMCIESVTGQRITPAQLKALGKLYVSTPAQIRNAFSSIKKQLVKYGQQIPWIKHLDEKGVTKFIQEIITFYKEFKDHSSVGVKTILEENKEKAETEKKRLIQVIKERVDACQKSCVGKQHLSAADILHKKCKGSQCMVDPQPSTSQQESYQDHICCAHCCGDLQHCPKYKQTGRSDFCHLTSMERMIEYLIREGYTESALLNGNPESMFCEVYYVDPEGEREELDDKDIADDEMHLYIKTKNDMAQSQVHSLFLQAKKDRKI